MIFIKQGDKPLTESQLQKRTQAYIDNNYPEWARERAIRSGDALFTDYMAQVVLDTDINRANNLFNQQLVDYSQAVVRLAQYELSVGRPEIVEQHPTGEKVLDKATGQVVDVLTPVVIQTAIEPLTEFVDYKQYDQATDAITTVQVRNPLIVQDEAERAEAQVIVDATPVEVVTYYESNPSII